MPLILVLMHGCFLVSTLLALHPYTFEWFVYIHYVPKGLKTAAFGIRENSESFYMLRLMGILVQCGESLPTL